MNNNEITVDIKTGSKSLLIRKYAKKNLIIQASINITAWNLSIPKLFNSAEHAYITHIRKDKIENNNIDEVFSKYFSSPSHRSKIVWKLKLIIIIVIRAGNNREHKIRNNLFVFLLSFKE